MLWESAIATEGASSKKTLGTNLSGRWNHNVTHLWRARIWDTPPKGNTLEYIQNFRVNLSGKRTEKGDGATATLFCPFLCPKKGNGPSIDRVHRKVVQ